MNAKSTALLTPKMPVVQAPVAPLGPKVAERIHMNDFDVAYAKGFMKSCEDRGIDPESLIKTSQQAAAGWENLPNYINQFSTPDKMRWAGNLMKMKAQNAFANTGNAAINAGSSSRSSRSVRPVS